MYSQYIAKTLEMAISTTSAIEIMRVFIEASAEKIQITNLLYFRVNPENRIELISSYGEALASLEGYKFIGRDRKLPVPDSINSGLEIYFRSPEQLKSEYEEVRSWKEIPQSLAVIPVNKLGVTIGCAVFTLGKAIESLEYARTFETFRAFAYLLELLKVHEFSGEPSLLGSKDGANATQALKVKNNGSVPAESQTDPVQETFKLDLSERQYKIAGLLASGATNSAIARQLGFSDATIRYETVKLYERLRVKNRSQASSRIREMGIS